MTIAKVIFTVTLLVIFVGSVQAQPSAPINVTINCDSAPPPYGHDFRVTYARKPSNKPILLIQLYKDEQAACWIKTANLLPWRAGGAHSSDTAWSIAPTSDSTLFSLYQLMIANRFLCDTHPDEPESVKQHQTDGVEEKVVVRTSGFVHTMEMQGQTPNWALNVIRRIREIARQ